MTTKIVVLAVLLAPVTYLLIAALLLWTADRSTRDVADRARRGGL